MLPDNRIRITARGSTDAIMRWLSFTQRKTFFFTVDPSDDECLCSSKKDQLNGLQRRRLDSETISRLNYRSFPRTTVIDPAGRVYMPSGMAAIVMFLSSAGVLQYCTRTTDRTNEWLM